MFGFMLFGAVSFGLGCAMSGRKTSQSILAAIIYFSVLFSSVIIAQMAYDFTMNFVRNISTEI